MNKKKANLMYFTNKPKFTPTQIRFGEYVLHHRTQVRWLGFWLDPKLRFNHHISVLQSEGIHALQKLRRLNKCFSGLNPKTARTLVIAVLRPKVLFGSIFWLTSDTLKKVLKIWDVLLNAANRLILGAFKMSPTNLMRHDSHMQPFYLTASQFHQNFYCKHLTAPEDHRTTFFLLHKLTSQPRSHYSCISHRINPKYIHNLFPKHFKTIHPPPDPPWTKKLGTIYNLDLKRDKQKTKLHHNFERKKKNTQLLFLLMAPMLQIFDVGQQQYLMTK